MFSQNGANELKPIGVDAFGDAAGDGDGAVDDEGLDFGGHGSGTFHDQGQNRAGGGFEATLKQELTGVSHFLKAAVGHAENTGFIGRAEAVFDAPQEPQFVLTVAGQLENGIDHVLEQFGPGDGAFFGDVTDDDHRDIGFFGGTDEEAGAIPDLGGRAGGGRIIFRRNGLNRVDNDEIGFEAAGVGEDFFERRSVEKINVRGALFGDSGDPGSHLADIFLGTDVEQG